MSQKTVNVCDVPLSSSVPSAACRRLADGNCLLCGIDACDEHLRYSFYIRIGTKSPHAPADTTRFEVPVAAEEIEVGLCFKCAMSAATMMHAAKRAPVEANFTSNIPKQSIHGDIESTHVSAHKPSVPAVFAALMDEMTKRAADELRVADATIRLGGKPGADK